MNSLIELNLLLLQQEWYKQQKMSEANRKLVTALWGLNEHK